ncbi:hypothetical protein ACFQLX_05930 [Streptomyces polyrhachis]|uniref:Mce-associated membrane protein n=1 Tax=Streptomyces polyrhachis TaxID=1282885 RepID=A0ABW2GDS9_9ACTN
MTTETVAAKSAAEGTPDVPEADVPEAAAPEAGGGERTPAAPPARRRRALLALLVAAVLAFTGYAGWSYATVSGDDDLAFSRERDRVLHAGQAHLARVNSIDAGDPATGLAGWLDATTGPLHEDLRKSKGASTAALKQSGRSARATVTEAAVTDLDTRGGTAKVLATVRIELSGGSTAEAVERKRFEAALQRTDDGWKLKSLTAITVEKPEEAK